MLRGLFNAYFLATGILCLLCAIAYAAAGGLAAAIALALLSAAAWSARSWFLRRMDAQLGRADDGAVRRLRRLHLGGMAYNAVQLAAVLGSIPLVFPGAG